MTTSLTHADFQGFTMAFDPAAQPVYIGKASSGTAKSAALWQIRKYIYVGADISDIQYANGSTNFDQIWDNRAALAYS